jgi:glycyl-tRNA synthetase beta chain
MPLSKQTGKKIGMFGLGQKPTGDKDPFALRRHALGVLRIVMERAIPTSTDSLIDASFAAFPEGLLGDAHADLGVFLKERLKGLLRDQGFSTNEVEAVVAADGGLSYVTAPKRLDAGQPDLGRWLMEMPECRSA